MAYIALALFGIYAVLGFGWRSWLQKRRTGSTGFKGVSGAVGSTEWFAGAGFVLAVAAQIAAPVLQAAGVLTPLSPLTATWLQSTGIVLALSGIAGTVFAQVQMGNSWRIGVDPTETTALVRGGVFGWVRNPIFTAMLTFGFGLALITPNALALIAFGVLLITIELQVRAVEEPYLAEVHGISYREYTATVGRFVPAIGRRISS